MNTKLKKVNAGLMLMYLLAPIVVAVVLMETKFSSYNFRLEGYIIVFMSIAVIGYLIVFFWIAALAFFIGSKRFQKYCKENRCMYDNYFGGKYVHVAVDTQHKTMGILFRFNPMSPFVVDMREVHDAKTDNGVGPLTLGGTKGVFFTFMVNNQKIKVWTCTSTYNLSLDSSLIVSGLAQADDMVEAINSVKEK